jgi:uncharacterized repeat protein (TIGR01451 family)
MNSVLRFSNRFFLLVLLLYVTSIQAQDTIPPVITMNPGSLGSIELRCDNSPYIDPGATAYDNRDGNLSPAIKAVSNVNTQRPGKYTVMYTVSDVSGNSDTVIRYVLVESKKYPVHFNAYNNGKDYLFTTYQYSPVAYLFNWLLDGDTVEAYRNEIAFSLRFPQNETHEICIVEKYCDGDTSLKYCSTISDTIADSRWITYQLFRDLNSNCKKDGNDQAFSAWGSHIELLNDTGFIVSTMFAFNSIGYSFIDSNTRYELRFPGSQDDTASIFCAGGSFSILPQNYQDTMLFMNLAYSCKPRLSDYTIWSSGASGRIFPGQNFQVFTSSGNKNFYSFNNCGRPDSGWLVFTLYGKGEFKSILGISLTPDTFTSKKIVIKVDNLNLFDKVKYAAFVIQTDTLAQAGDSISVLTEIICPAAETNKLNNVLYRRYIVLNSYDPNMKSVDKVKVSPGFEDWLTYTIDFQNTGNAEAINIKLKDTLDSELDENSFVFLDASHQVQLSRQGKALQFKFDNINLPDSGSDQAGSHGFVIYKVKPRQPMVLNQTIRNTAYIYFDFNEPVVTNTALTYTFVSNGSISSDNNNAFKLWPNPTQTELHFQSEHFVSGIASLMDVYGKLIRTVSFDARGRIDMAELPAGIYILQLSSLDQTVAYKVIKQ